MNHWTLQVITVSQVLTVIISTKRSLWKKICALFSPSKLLASSNRNITYDRDLYLSRFVTSDSDLFSDDRPASKCLTSTELAVSLIILNAGYHLSHQCVNDVLRLFRDFQIDVTYLRVINR